VRRWSIGVQQPCNLHAIALSQDLARFMLSHAAGFVSMEYQLAQESNFAMWDRIQAKARCMTSLQCVQPSVLHVRIYA